MLDSLNAHPRDVRIEFDEPTHVYTIDGEEGYTSVTTFIHHNFPKFDADKIISKMRVGKNWEKSKYYGMTDEEIKDSWEKNRDEAASAGTKMHLNIEYFYNNIEREEDYEETKEWSLFKKYLEDHKDYEAYRTEWCVFSKKYKIAGSIDMVYKDPENEGSYIICDWKRSKEIKTSNWYDKGLGHFAEYDSCNYWHYTFQLNTYRLILESYYGLKITEMFLVILHPKQDTYKKIIIPRASKPILKSLSDKIKNND